MANTSATEHHDDIPAMDYPQHEATYRGFIALIKGGIANLVFVVLALYCFIEAHNAILGVVLLLLSVVVPIGMTLLGRRKA